MKIKEGFLNVAASFVAIAAGLLLGLVVLLITDYTRAFPAFLTVLTHGVSSLRNFGDVLLRAAPVIMTGLSVGFAHKTGLFNIGASGQFTFGSFAAVFVALQFDYLPFSDISTPAGLRIITAILAAALAGAIWGSIPGLLKAYRNVHEVISCIMTNYIGMFLVNFLILNSIFDPLRNSTRRIPSAYNMPRWGLDYIFRDDLRASNVGSGIILAIILAVITYIILEKTTFGYELKACGFNKDAAKYAGINENRNIVLSMMISGALAGLGGAFWFLSGAGVEMRVADVLAMEGFTGISVALLGMSNPLGIIFTGTLIAYLQSGGFGVQAFGFVPEVIEIVVAVIIYFSAFVMLVKGLLTGRFGKLGRIKTTPRLY